MRPTPILREDIVTTPNNPAPWSPVPLQKARKFVNDHPDAAISVVFPAVHEEDRSRTILDLSGAYNLKVISHKRMSEHVAREMGIEEYDYLAEQEDIREEQSDTLLHPPDMLGAGDSLAAAAGGSPMNASSQPDPKATTGLSGGPSSPTKSPVRAVPAGKTPPAQAKLKPAQAQLKPASPPQTPQRPPAGAAPANPGPPKLGTASKPAGGTSRHPALAKTDARQQAGSLLGTMNMHTAPVPGLGGSRRAIDAPHKAAMRQRQSWRRQEAAERQRAKKSRHK